MPGGLAYAVILVGAILGAITGTVAASVIAMGMISLPIMLRYGYDMRIATGVIAASGTITQVIPPSLVLVVLADQLGSPVGDMYLGAIGPSILQVAIFVLYIFVPLDRASRRRCRRCRRRSAVTCGWRADHEGALGHGAVDRADLPRARHHLHGPRDADGGGRDGRGRRHRARRHCIAASTWPMICGGDELDHADHRDGGVHPDRRDRASAWSFRA